MEAIFSLSYFELEHCKQMYVNLTILAIYYLPLNHAQCGGNVKSVKPGLSLALQ